VWPFYTYIYLGLFTTTWGILTLNHMVQRWSVPHNLRVFLNWYSVITNYIEIKLLTQLT